MMIDGGQFRSCSLTEMTLDRHPVCIERYLASLEKEFCHEPDTATKNSPTACPESSTVHNSVIRYGVVTL